MNRKFSLVKDLLEMRGVKKMMKKKHLRPPHSTVPCFNYWLSRIKSRSLLLFLTKISLPRSAYSLACVLQVCVSWNIFCTRDFSGSYDEVPFMVVI